MSSPPAAPTDVSIGSPPGGDDASFDITESGPPAEVLDQMARADAINARLREEGREIRFALSADGCSLQIELCEISGQLIRTLTARELAEIAVVGEDL